MRKLMKTITVLFIALCFLIPVANANTGNENKETDTENTMNSIDSVDLTKLNEKTISTQVKPDRCDYVFDTDETKPRTRAEGDLKFVDDTSTLSLSPDTTFQPLYWEQAQGTIQYAWGTKNKPITYTPVVENTGSGQVDTFSIMCVVTEAIFDPNEGEHGAWKINTVDPEAEIYNHTKNLGPLAGNTNTSTAGINTDFSWTPGSAGRVRILFMITAGVDPDTSNNGMVWWPYIMQVYNEVETGPEQNEWTDGNGWDTKQLTGQEDPNPAHHSAPTVWECGAVGVQYLEYPISFNNLKPAHAPFWGGVDVGKEEAFIGWSFSGPVGVSSWTMGFWNSTTNSWDDDMTGNQNIHEGWFSYGYGDPQADGYRLYGSRLDEHYATPNFKVRFTGANLWIDDLWVMSIENLGDPVPPEKIPPELKFDITTNDAFVDSGGKEHIVDQEFYPGNEYTWNFTIENTATTSTDPYYDHPIGATIKKVEFKNLTKPEGWDVTLQNIIKDIAPGESEPFTLTVKIPKDARATIYYETRSSWNPYIISFDATATPTTTTPAATPGLAFLEETIERETLVKEIIGIEVSVDEDNKTGIQGFKHEYTITIENTGNCNLTEDLEAEIAIEVTDDPPGLWSVNLDEEKLEIEYGESEEVTVSITSPINEKAGFFPSEITISIEEFDIEEIITLITGVDQVYGLELDFKDRNDNAHEVDPTQSHQLFKPITFEINNLGNGEDIAKFEVTAEDSEDDDWVDMEEDTITLEPVGGLHAEEDFVIEFNIPEDAAEGDHLFTVKAVSEKDESGDTETGEREITFTILRPDLTVSTMFDFEPEAPVLGEETLISARIFNNGTTTATSFSVYLYITEEGENEEFVGYQLVNILQKGQLMDLPPFEYIFEEFKEYTIRVEVDPENVNVTEIDETNNEAQTTIMVIAPDLEFKKEEVLIEAGLDTLILNEEGNFDLEKITSQTEYSITITVKNDGDSDASKVQVNLKIMYLDADQNEWKETEDNVTIDSIKAGKTGSATFTWIPGLWATQYSFELTVDPEDKIPESGENNNKWTPPELFVTPKKPVKKSPGFELIFLVISLVLVGAVLYRKRK